MPCHPGLDHLLSSELRVRVACPIDPSPTGFVGVVEQFVAKVEVRACGAWRVVAGVQHPGASRHLAVLDGVGDAVGTVEHAAVADDAIAVVVASASPLLAAGNRVELAAVGAEPGQVRRRLQRCRPKLRDRICSLSAPCSLPTTATQRSSPPDRAITSWL